MPRNDPTDTGGLFIGRRPGTGPVHLRGEPSRGGSGRRRADEAHALVLLLGQGVLCLSVWGPQPLAWLWIGSQADYWLDSHMGGIAIAFAGILASLFVTLSRASRLDRLWRCVRRAAGHEQRDGALTRIFGGSAIVALVLFGIWFLVIQGPAPDIG